MRYRLSIWTCGLDLIDRFDWMREGSRLTLLAKFARMYQYIYLLYVAISATSIWTARKRTSKSSHNSLPPSPLPLPLLLLSQLPYSDRERPWSQHVWWTLRNILRCHLRFVGIPSSFYHNSLFHHCRSRRIGMVRCFLRSSSLEDHRRQASLSSTCLLPSSFSRRSCVYAAVRRLATILLASRVRRYRAILMPWYPYAVRRGTGVWRMDSVGGTLPIDPTASRWALVRTRVGLRRSVLWTTW